MNQIAGTMVSTQCVMSQSSPHFFDEQDEDAGFKTLSHEEAQALQAAIPSVSLQKMLCWQLLAGFFVVVLASFWGGYEGVMTSVVAGVLAAWLPSALFVWRMTALQKSACTPHTTLAFFFVWEAVKVLCAIALLVVAIFYIHSLVWQALLAGFVVTVKAYGIACWLSLSKNKQVES